jgi:hypothetical protein
MFTKDYTFLTLNAGAAIEMAFEFLGPKHVADLSMYAVLNHPLYEELKRWYGAPGEQHLGDRFSALTKRIPMDLDEESFKASWYIYMEARTAEYDPVYEKECLKHSELTPCDIKNHLYRFDWICYQIIRDFFCGQDRALDQMYRLPHMQPKAKYHQLRAMLSQEGIDVFYFQEVSEEQHAALVAEVNPSVFFISQLIEGCMVVLCRENGCRYEEIVLGRDSVAGIDVRAVAVKKTDSRSKSQVFISAHLSSKSSKHSQEFTDLLAATREWPDVFIGLDANHDLSTKDAEVKAAGFTRIVNSVPFTVNKCRSALQVQERKVHKEDKSSKDFILAKIAPVSYWPRSVRGEAKSVAFDEKCDFTEPNRDEYLPSSTHFSDHYAVVAKVHVRCVDLVALRAYLAAAVTGVVRLCECAFIRA